MRPRLPFLLVGFAAVALVAAGVGAAAFAGTGFGPVAFSVNGHQVSQSTVNDDLKAFAASKGFGGSAASARAGSIDNKYTRYLLNLRIASLAAEEELADRGESVTAADRSSATKTIDSAGRDLFTPRARRLLIELDGPLSALSRVLGGDQALNDELTTALRKAHVKVDQRYGVWNRAGAQVCPPTGCVRIQGSSG